jgi:hypothetical protein
MSGVFTHTMDDAALRAVAGLHGGASFAMADFFPVMDASRV